MVKIIGVDDVRKMVRKFNENLLLKESEKIVDDVFLKYKDKYTEIQKFLVIDRMWSANSVRYGKLKALDIRLKEIEEYLNKMQNDINKYKNKKLEELSEDEIGYLAKIFEKISIDKFYKGKKQKKTRSYASLSKYLHWTNPYVFPIYDSRFMKAIKKMNQKISNYYDIINFYSKLLKKYSENEINELKCIAKHNKDYGGYDLENWSILRVLDKYFYEKGKKLEENEK